ncbi:MAG TPA: hypothetical protein VFS31_11910, partial [Chitinophagaceae bacterium]|nr:hypothetical protein [Chitinophagaceae bacterium]
MPYATIYRIQFTNTEGALTFVEIADKNSYAPDALTDYIDLLGGPSPLVIQSLDTDENKFTPIRAKSASIQFYSTDTIGIHTFTGEDDRWIVTAWVITQTNVIFRGLLVMNDNSQGYVT